VRQRGRQVRRWAAEAGERPDRVSEGQCAARLLRDRAGQRERAAAVASVGAPGVGRKPHGTPVSPFAGRVTHILVKAGDRVKAGPDAGGAGVSRLRPGASRMRAARNPISPWLKRISTGCGAVRRRGFLAQRNDHRGSRLRAAPKRSSRVPPARFKLLRRRQRIGRPEPRPTRVRSTGIVVERNINPAQELRPESAARQLPGDVRHHRPVPPLGAARCDREPACEFVSVGRRCACVLPPGRRNSFEATVETISDSSIPPPARSRCAAPSSTCDDQKLKGEMFVTASSRTVVRGRPAACLKNGAGIFRQADITLFVEESQGRFAWNEVEVEGSPRRSGRCRFRSRPRQKVVVEGTLLLHRLYRSSRAARPPEAAHPDPAP